ncbi:hypothetical protein CAPTEDRAFT_149416 [Capitella teleta]|uniref:Protein YIF1 n=1 Tax=Capitella teleta TaxID=283909 RepID=R7UBC1_CAPTE|nr:hypothetical protein CAPTEDRAFT_149416 [Capitella teleta]|eukprot:ELU01098.1 hypothetical protein CAPTEDRAFT_149416 [Capitella teleta]
MHCSLGFAHSITAEIPEMNPNPEVRHPGPRRPHKMRGGHKTSSAQNPQLFDDTSATQPPPGPYAMPPPVYGEAQGMPGASYTPEPGYGVPGNMAGPPQYPGAQYMNDPMANAAVQYGQTLAGQGKDYLHKNMEKYVSASKLKYYFAVDTSYVGKKLCLLLFPFAHTDWSIKFNQDEPVAPRYEVNAPDLYIPVMAFVTYILVAGVALGTQNRFTPEHLGVTSSTALVWTILEIIILLIAMYVINVATDLKYLDLLAYCGYKYVGMLLALIGGLLFQSSGYYIVLLWTSISIAFFLVRSLKLAIMPHSDPDNYIRGNKRRLYFLLFVALSQPLLMWWLTNHLVQ